MRYINEHARKDSFYAVPETCPIIDAGLSALNEIIKEQTNKFRDALTEAIKEKIIAEEMVSDLEDTIKILEKEIEELKSEGEK